MATAVVAYQIGLHRYAFVLPSSLVAVAEVTAIAVWHPSLGAVLGVLVAGHAAFLATTFIGTGARMRP